MSVFQDYFVDTIKTRYSLFDGRASRSEFWYYQLFYVAIYLALVVAASILGFISETLALIPAGLIFIMALGLLIPGLGLAIRRLHDTDKSGWFILIGFIPIIGGIILLVFFCLESTPGSNQYGPHPYDGDSISGSQNFDDIIDR